MDTATYCPLSPVVGSPNGLLLVPTFTLTNPVEPGVTAT